MRPVVAELSLLSLFNLFFKPPSKAGEKTERCSTVRGSAARLSERAQKATARAKMSANRELVVKIVRDAMLLSEVLSGSYKFKALSLNREGDKFAILMDIPAPLQGGPSRQRDVESFVKRLAKERHAIVVTAMYWRSADLHGTVAPTREVSPVRPASGRRRVQAGPGAEEHVTLSPTNFGEIG
jgi:hypothetical protein